MSNVIIAQRMWQRRDTAANWTARNPVLSDGEIGFERDIPFTYVKMKIGNGDSRWNDLPYFSASSSLSMRIDSGFVQYSSDGVEWSSLISLEDLRGPPGIDFDTAMSSLGTIEDAPIAPGDSLRTMLAKLQGQIDAINASAGGETLLQSFTATGSEVTYEVPAGVSLIRAHVVGAAGGGGVYATGLKSGAGGYTVGDISVTPGQVLRIRVGGGGKGGKYTSPQAGGLGGWPGGGSGAFGDTWCGGGGGYSGVFLDDGSPLLLAGGGGGASGYSLSGGNGGGLTGGDSAGGATGGSQTAGGSGGGSGYAGSAYQGGNADGGNRTVSTSRDDGGGGGGYYGGGAPGGDGLPGAGGSGYVDPSVSNAASYRNPVNGESPTQKPDFVLGVGLGLYGNAVGTVSASDASNGGDGVVVLVRLS